MDRLLTRARTVPIPMRTEGTGVLPRMLQPRPVARTSSTQIELLAKTQQTRTLCAEEASGA